MQITKPVFHPKRAGIVLVLTVPPLLLLLAFYNAGFRWARTPSLPPGIYRLTSNPADPLVSFCPEGNVSKVSTERHYREEAWTCPDHFAPLLKPIAARSGDVVKVTKNGISVNGLALPNTRSYPYDRQHLPMNPWPEGTYIVQPGTIWVLSTYNSASYDSRYFGPISERLILNHAHPVWQFR
jgi:conjugative transfer signal peptidase TraF